MTTEVYLVRILVPKAYRDSSQMRRMLRDAAAKCLTEHISIISGGGIRCSVDTSVLAFDLLAEFTIPAISISLEAILTPSLEAVRLQVRRENPWSPELRLERQRLA